MNSEVHKSYTAAQLRKLCTGKPVPTRGFHPSHRCKDIHLITPTAGPVCFYAHTPKELKNRRAWHKEAMGDWLSDPRTRKALVQQIQKNLCGSKAEALQSATVYTTTRFIEDGKLFFVTVPPCGGRSISQL
jgi:hypothetical protein